MFQVPYVLAPWLVPPRRLALPHLRLLGAPVLLLRTTKPGGVYLGVAPDQNFTYLIALKPRIAFIVDIRRQNMIHHLMYKAMIEMSPNRADFMSMLFARARPAGLDTESTPEALFNGYANVSLDTVLYAKNLAAITDWL